MTKKEIANKYLEFLDTGNIEQVVKLFSKSGIVVSPIYGIKKAHVFFNTLSNDTSNSQLTLLEIFEQDNSNTIALYFNYKWTLKNKEQVTFDVVDIIEFNTLNEIVKLKIVYDTFVARQLVDNQEK